MTVVAVVGNPNAGGRTTHRWLPWPLPIAVATVIGGSDIEIIELADIAAQPVRVGATPVGRRAHGARLLQPTWLLPPARPTRPPTPVCSRRSSTATATTPWPGAGAVPVMLGGRRPSTPWPPRCYLRPLLVELGASVPTRGLYVLESQVDDLDSIVATWGEKATAGSCWAEDWSPPWLSSGGGRSPIPTPSWPRPGRRAHASRALVTRPACPASPSTAAAP